MKLISSPSHGQWATVRSVDIDGNPRPPERVFIAEQPIELPPRTVGIDLHTRGHVGLVAVPCKASGAPTLPVGVVWYEDPEWNNPPGFEPHDDCGGDGCGHCTEGYVCVECGSGDAAWDADGEMYCPDGCRDDTDNDNNEEDTE